MIRTTVKVEGLRELRAGLMELPKATGTRVLRKALTTAGEPIEAAAERLAPVEVGTLQRSIVVSGKLSGRQRKKHKKQSKVEVYIGPGPLSQATQQEFGNVNHGPQPFMRPAFDSNKNTALNIFKKELSDEIKKAADRIAKRAARLLTKMRT